MDLYLECWYSGQIPERDMLERLSCDPELRRYYEEKNNAKDIKVKENRTS